MGRQWNELVKISGNHLEYGVAGHYRVGVRIAIVATQAANSRLFAIRNPHQSNLIIPTRINVRWLQTGNHTAAIEDSIDLYKATGFTAVDSADVATPTVSVMRGGTMAAVPGNAEVRHVTATGVAAGMTGGTLTADSSPLSQLPKWFFQTQPTSGGVLDEADLLAKVEGQHPLILRQNEGFVIRNRVLLGAAAASAIYLDVSWAEVHTYD